MTSLPPIDAATLPAEVRKGSAQDKQLYSAALSFEEQLTKQLTQEIVNSALPGTSDDGSSGDGSSDDGGSSDQTTSLYAQQLPDALAQGISSSGGLGLAPALWRALGGGRDTSVTTSDPTSDPGSDHVNGASS